jgi:hypothetical protein
MRRGNATCLTFSYKKLPDLYTGCPNENGPPKITHQKFIFKKNAKTRQKNNKGGPILAYYVTFIPSSHVAPHAPHDLIEIFSL